MRHEITLAHSDALHILRKLDGVWQFVGLPRPQGAPCLKLLLEHEEMGLNDSVLVLREDGTWYFYTELKLGNDHGKA